MLKDYKHDVKEKPVQPFVYVPAKHVPGLLAIPMNEISQHIIQILNQKGSG